MSKLGRSSMTVSLVFFSKNYVTASPDRIRIVDSIEPKLEVEGFATYTDVQAADLVPWTPLKTGYSHMDTESALLILRRVAPQFVGVVSAEAATLPEGEGERERVGEVEIWLVCI